MVEIAEIVDRQSFEGWLKQEDLPREAMVAIASRSALRFSPLLWSDVHLQLSGSDGNLAILSVFRCLLSSTVFVLADFSDIRLALGTVAATASNDSRFFAEISETNSLTKLLIDIAGSAAFAAAAFDIDDTVAAAVDVVASITPDTWSSLQLDCILVADPRAVLTAPLWADGTNPLRKQWKDTKAHFEGLSDHPWPFWLDWYQRLLDGTEDRWDLLTDIALLDKDADGNDLWQDPEKLAAEIARLEAAYVAKQDNRTPLANAYPVDFTLDALNRVMRMVGIEDDMAHLRDPAVVQAFLDDCGELRDTLRDFCEFAQEMNHGGNQAGVLRLAAEKVLDELTRVEDQTHLRARHVVRLATRLEAFSKEESKREELGETLSGMLDESVAFLRSTTRKHFGPAYTALAPLAQLSLDQVDQDAVLRLFDDMLSRMEVMPEDDLLALDVDGINVLRDMQRELEEFRAAIAEADSDAFRDLLESRFAESMGSTGLAYLRFIERSSDEASSVGEITRRTVDDYQRVETLAGIVKAIAGFVGGSGGG